jgi:ketosteroid isomerase-like protein
MLRLAPFVVLVSCASARSPDVRDVVDVLDRFHAVAAAADEDKYFALLAPEAVFLGTDASERWTKSEFRAYAHPYFAKGRGWTYRSRDRHVSILGTVAYFDEMLDHDSYGELRGTGVLRREDQGTWRIVQYNLTFTVPNDKADKVVELIR